MTCPSLKLKEIAPEKRPKPKRKGSLLITMLQKAMLDFRECRTSESKVKKHTRLLLSNLGSHSRSNLKSACPGIVRECNGLFATTGAVAKTLGVRALLICPGNPPINIILALMKHVCVRSIGEGGCKSICIYTASIFPKRRPPLES